MITNKWTGDSSASCPSILLACALVVSEAWLIVFLTFAFMHEHKILIGWFWHVQWNVNEMHSTWSFKYDHVHDATRKICSKKNSKRWTRESDIRTIEIFWVSFQILNVATTAKLDLILKQQKPSPFLQCFLVIFFCRVSMCKFAVHKLPNVWSCNFVFTWVG